METAIKFSYRKFKSEEGRYRVYVGDLFVGDVYPEWGPWRPKAGWGPATGVQERDRIGWIASASHSVTIGVDNLHSHATKREDAAQALWEKYTAHGWDQCPVGKGFVHPWEDKPVHTCTPVE